MPGTPEPASHGSPTSDRPAILRPPALDVLPTALDAPPDEVSVAPTGPLDLVTATALELEIRELQKTGPGRIMIDLRGVDFLDSTGLRVLLSLRNEAKRNHHALTLVPGPPDVQRVFALTATRGLFDWREQ